MVRVPLQTAVRFPGAAYIGRKKKEDTMARKFGAISNFIREHNQLTAQELVTKGAKRGLRFDTKRVYAVRKRDSVTLTPMATKRIYDKLEAPHATLTRTAATGSPEERDHVNEFIILIGDLGLLRAQALLDVVRKQFENQFASTRERQS